MANALPSLQQHADWVTPSENGAGVAELADALVRDDLDFLDARLGRHDVPFGEQLNGAAYLLRSRSSRVLAVGGSGGGKSTAVNAFVQRLVASGFQCCVFDPEGDHEELPGAVTLGAGDREPDLDQLIQVLALPSNNCVVSLLGVPLESRPASFNAALARLRKLHAQTSRPHWVVLDEAHHLLEDGPELPRALDLPGASTLIMTVSPERVARALLQTVNLVLVFGPEANDTLEKTARLLGHRPPTPGPEIARTGDLLAWRVGEGHARQLHIEPKRKSRRHQRKYAEGALGPDKCFYFRGVDGRLNLRAQNLVNFCELARGVDSDTWLYHLGRGDYSRWVRHCIKDEGLADALSQVEQGASLTPGESVERICSAISERYTAPA